MMKKISLLLAAALTVPYVIADYGMMGYGMGSRGMWFYGTLWFAIAVFVFSLIFWGTYKLIMQDKKHKKER